MTVATRLTLALVPAALLAPLRALGESLPPAEEPEPPLEPYSEPYVDPDTLPVESVAKKLLSEEDFLKLGLAFVAGLACGYALKVAFRIAMVALLVIVLGIAALQTTDKVQIDWSGLVGDYGTWADWTSVNSSALLDYVRDNLAGSVSFFVGLTLGLKL